MKHVLVVEDSVNLLTVIGKALRDVGYSFTGTNNGADALAAIQHGHPPDVVLLDLMMHGMDGYEFLDRLGPTAPPVIVMTGADKVDSEKFDESKVVRVLMKPFDPVNPIGVLLEAIHTAIKSREKKNHDG